MKNSDDAYLQKCDKCGRMVDTVHIVGWTFEGTPALLKLCHDCYDSEVNKDAKN